MGDILQLKFSSGIAGDTIAPSKIEKGDALSDSQMLVEESPSVNVKPRRERALSGSWKKPRWDVEEVIKRGVIDTTA